MARTAEVIYVGDAESLIRASKQAAAASVESADKIAASNEKIVGSSAKAAKAHDAGVKSFVNMGKAAAIGVVGVAAASADLAIKMEKATASIAKASSTSVGEAKKIEDAFKGTSGSAEFSATKIGAAFATIAGELKTVEGHALGSAEAMKVMKAAMDLADATGGELNSTTEALGKVMLTYSLHANQASEASDVLFNAAKATGTSVETLAQTVDRMHGRLGALAPSLQESAGLMADFASHGVTGRLVMGALGGTFNTLLGGGKATNAMLAELGVHVFDNSGKFVGLASVISQLHPKLEKLTEQSQLQATKALFGASANKIMLAIIQQGPHAFEASTAAMSKHGTATDAARKQHETLEGKLKIEKAAVENLTASLGEKLIPVLSKVVTGLTEGIKWLEKHKAAADALGLAIGVGLSGVIAVFVADKVKTFVGGIGDMVKAAAGLSVKMGITAGAVEAENAAMVSSTEAAAVSMDAALISTGIGAAVVALGIAAYELGTHWSEVMHTLESATESAGNEIIKVLNKIKTMMEIVAEGPLALRRLVPGLGGSVIPNIPNIEGLGPGPGSLSGTGHNTAYVEAKSQNDFRHSVVENMARRYGIDPKVLWGVYGNETSYGANITTSSAGAMGAFQFIPSTAKEYGYPLTNKPSPNQFRQQAASAAKYLSTLIHRFHGDVTAALQAYSGNTPGYAQNAYQHGASFGTGTLPGAGKIEKLHEYLGPNGELLSETAAQHGHRSLMERKAKIEGQYVNPFAGATGVHRSRTDQGVDFSFGGALGAIGPGIIEKVKNFQGFGETIVERLTGGKHKGQRIYTGLETGGHGIVHAGQHVRAGQAIAHGYGSGGIEMGFAGPEGLPITRYAPGQSHEHPTVGGEAFARFLATLGKGGSNLQLATAYISQQEKAESRKRSADEKLGRTELNHMLATIHSGKLADLAKMVDGAHTVALMRLEKRLSGDHTSALDKLVRELAAAHRSALAAMRRAQGEASAKWGQAMETFHSKMDELVSKAGASFQKLEQTGIEALYKATMKAIEGGPESAAIKAKRKEDEAESAKHTEESNAEALDAANKRVKEARGNENPEELKKALHDVKLAEEAITAFARQQDEKRREESVNAEKEAAGEKRETALSALEQQTVEYEANLSKQLNALLAQLEKGEIAYATYAAKVNAILAAAGVAPITGPGPGVDPSNPEGWPANPAEWPQWEREHGAHHGQHRASGGGVIPGVSYTVGETGPERFTPSTAGTITPASRSGGAHSGPLVHIENMHMHNRQDVDRFAHQLAMRLTYGGRL